MQNKKLLTLIALIAVSLGKQATANEAVDNRIYIAPSVSYLHLDNDRNTGHNRSGYGANIAVGKAINDNINLEVKALYNVSKQDDRPAHRTKFESYGVTVDGLYYFTRDTIAPYAVAGIGAMNTDVNGDTPTGLIAEAGAGAAFKVNDNLSLRSDVRYRYNHNFSRIKGFDNTNNFDDVVFNVGVVIPFGVKKAEAAPVQRVTALDSDNDGVLDAYDQCPNTKPGVAVNKFGCNQGVNLVDVNFKYDSYELTPKTQAALDKVASDLITKPQNKSIEIQGHTSSEGTAQYNLVLSEKRANSVVKYLNKKNVPNKLTAKGYGETRLIADEATEEGRMQNRRVEMVWE